MFTFRQTRRQFDLELTLDALAAIGAEEYLDGKLGAGLEMVKVVST